jgi:4-amino-4-deoxy-L-arabinose transferase-like glycosyltransferase
VWLLTAIGCVLRFTRLGAQSIWVDEGMTIAWIAEIESRGWGTLVENIHGPLHAAAVYLASRVSMDEWWLRVPSAVAGTLAIPALAQLGRRLWSPRVGLTAAALLAVSPFALYYSQEVRSYSFTIVFASLTMAAAWDLVRRPTWRTGVTFVVFELLAVLSNLNGVFLAVGLNIWVSFALARNRRAWLVWLLPHALVGLVLAPYAWRAGQQVRPERLLGVETGLGEDTPLRGETTLHPMGLPYSAFALAAGYSIGPTLEELRADPGAAARKRHWPTIVAITLGFGVPLLAGTFGPRARPGIAPLLSVAVVVTGFTVWLAATNIKPFNVRYLSVVLPVFLVLVARGIWLLARPWRVATAAVVLIASLWSCANYLFVPRYGRDDARGAVQYVLAHARVDDLVIHTNLGFPLRYYDDLPQRVKHADPRSGASLEAARQYVDRIREGHAALWFMESRVEKLDPNGYLRRACEERAVTSETRDFVGIKLHHFDFQESSRDSGS